MERRLAAVLSIDVAGYARLMGRDEAGTLAALKAHRAELIDPQAVLYGGKTIKLMGDGALMEFVSAVDAVRFAVAVQCAMRGRNSSVPEDQRIAFRIGINIGDVIADDGDIHGDGVNVAARLEGLAEAGGICIRRNVRNQVRDKLALDFEDLGDVEVKNIKRPVRAFHVMMNEKAEILAAVPAEAPKNPLSRLWHAVAGIALSLGLVAMFTWWQPWGSDFEPVDPDSMEHPLPAKPSLAVLAFNDLSTGADKEYLSDAIAEGIITELSRFSQLFVIARNSSFHYRGKAMDVRAIARELGVRYILEGSQQKAGEQLRVTVQLIDAVAGNHVWADTYDRELADFFRVQDEIAGAVASTVGGKLVIVASNEAARADPEQLRAFGYWLKGMKYWHDWTREGNLKALESFERAVEADPELSYGHIGLAWAYMNGFRYGWTPIGREEALKRARATAQRGLELAPDDHFSIMSMAYVLMVAGESEAAVIKFREALTRNPNSTDVMGTLAEQLGYIGQGEEAIALLEAAMRRDPHHPDWVKWSLGWIQYNLGFCGDALATMLKMSNLPGVANRTVAASYVCLGQLNEARAAINELLASEPYYSIADVRAAMRDRMKIPAELERWIGHMREAGLPE